MFTGIIEAIGTIKKINTNLNSSQIVIEMDNFFNDLKLGDSIAVNGVCLTIVEIQNNQFTVDVSPETLTKSTLKNSRIHEILNLERAMRIDNRFNGHIVSGHVDGIGIIESKTVLNNSIIYNFKIDSSLIKYIALKGSIAIDGISLTISSIKKNNFEVSIIPFTLKHTTLNLKKIGDSVNIECDILCKYIERLINYNSQKEDSTITSNFLKNYGFI